MCHCTCKVTSEQLQTRTMIVFLHSRAIQTVFARDVLPLLSHSVAIAQTPMLQPKLTRRRHQFGYPAQPLTMLNDEIFMRRLTYALAGLKMNLYRRRQVVSRLHIVVLTFDIWASGVV